MTFLYRFAILLVLVFVSASSTYAGSTPLTYDRVSLSVQATEQVDNDVLVVVMYAQAEGTDSAALSKSVNRSIADGLDMVRRQADVSVQTLNYQVVPVYSDKRLSGWRVKQAIRLESTNLPVLSALVGDLQATLAVQSMSYKISDEKRKVAEDRLIEKAINQFSERAALITRTLGSSGYRVVQINISSNNQAPRPYLAMAEGASRRGAAAPVVEAGTQAVTVNINGTVEAKVD